MKKLLTAILLGAFAVSASAQYLIYNYKASFKRVDPVYQKVSYAFDSYSSTKKDFTGYFDTFQVASDSLNGYLIIPACDDCLTPADAAAFGWDDFGSGDDTSYTAADPTLLVTRKGDKLYKTVWYFDNSVYVDAAMFNKGVALRIPTGGDTLAGTPSSIKKIKTAWGILSYSINNTLNTTQTISMKGMTSNQTTTYGFLGYQSMGGSIDSTGFGSVSVITNDGSTTIGFCGNTVIPGTQCIAVNKISGSIVGGFGYAGLCAAPPMFDICDYTGVGGAPISGTWSLSINKSLSTKFGDNYATAAAALAAKLGASSPAETFDGD